MELLPTDWAEVSLSTYIDILNITSTGQLARSIDTLAILTEDDVWDNLPTTAIYTAMKRIAWLNTTPTTNITPVVAGLYTYMPTHLLTVGEWIDMENFILTKNYVALVAMFYRQTELDKWGNILYEPYIYNPNTRGELYLDLPISTVYGSIEAAIKFRDDTIHSYPDVFDTLDNVDEIGTTEDDQKYLTSSEIQELKKSVALDNMKKSYGWNKILDDVCNSNWADIEKLTTLPVIFFFNMLRTKKLYATSSITN